MLVPVHFEYFSLIVIIIMTMFGCDQMLMCTLVEVNNYIVRSYRDVIVVTNPATGSTNKAYEYSHVLKYKKHY